MARKLFAIAVALVGLAVSACGGRMLGGNGGSAGGGTFVLPQIDSDLVVTAVLPKDTIGEEKPKGSDRSSR
jgi:hypothetical protein